MKYQPLPDWEYIKGIVLFVSIMSNGFRANPRYPSYWRLVKEAVIS